MTGHMANYWRRMLALPALPILTAEVPLTHRLFTAAYLPVGHPAASSSGSRPVGRTGRRQRNTERRRYGRGR